MTKLNTISGYGDDPARRTSGLSGVYKSMVAAEKQKTFQSVLKEAGPGGGDLSALGKDFPQMELNSLNPPHPAGTWTAVDAASEAQADIINTLSQGGLNDMAAAALLKAYTLSGNSNLQFYAMQGMGLRGGSSAVAGSAAGAAAGAGTGKSRSFRGVPSASGDLGSVAAGFESGDNGVAAIGYDYNGGTSYGTYQISSRQGTMKGFLEFLDDHYPGWAAKLRSAGPANTGSRQGAMPNAWKELAAQEPEQFARLQRDFIEQSHYTPALQAIQERTDVDVSKRSKALQEALWSTAVQHGPNKAAKLFSRAIERAAADGGNLSDAELIEDVYAARGGDFGSSSSRVRSAVRGRFREEKEMLIAMLENESHRA